MSLSFYSVAIPTTRTKLSTLIAALVPQMTIGGVTGQITQRGRQITVQASPGNTASTFILIGGPTLAVGPPLVNCGAELAPGAGWNYGAGAGIADALDNIWVMTTGAATDQLLFSVTD